MKRSKFNNASIGKASLFKGFIAPRQKIYFGIPCGSLSNLTGSLVQRLTHMTPFTQDMIPMYVYEVGAKNQKGNNVGSMNSRFKRLTSIN
jgi:hypothetical protein